MLYRQCYLPAQGLNGTTWERRFLPNVGGAGEQDAWTLAAMEFVAAEHQLLMNEEAKRDARERAERRRKKRESRHG